MINCSNCGKENQDHYKFCLGCGARLAGAPIAVPSATVSPGGQPVRTGGTVVAGQQAASAPQASPAPPRIGNPGIIAGVTNDTNTGRTPARPDPVPVAESPRVATGPMFSDGGVDPTRPVGAPRTEPSAACRGCGMVNPAGFLFCGRCGARLGAPSGPSDAAEALVTTMAAPVSPGAGILVGQAGQAAQVVQPAPMTAGGTVVSTVRKPGLRASMHLLREDGSEGGTLHLEDGPVPFGRDYGPPFDTDFYLNPRHCAFTVAAEGVRVDDLSPINGVYRKIEGSIELQHGDTFRVGQELLYYEDLPEPEVLPDGTERMGSPNPGYWGRVSVLVETGRACEAMPVIGAEFTVGRERGDLTFPTDGYVSSSHCRIVGDDSGVYLEDRGSSNGTYLRVRSGTVVPFGSLVLIGQQLFHVRKA